MGFFSGILDAAKDVFGSVASAVSPLSSALSPISGLLSSGIGMLGQMSTNRSNVGIASANNAAAIDLANTAYQRRVKDLSSAGLNSMLAYSQGGAQVPSLQQATVGNSAKAGLESAVATATLDQIKAQTRVADTQANLNSAAATKTMAETTGISYTNELNTFLKDKFQSWYVAGEGVDAQMVENQLRRLKANNSQNEIDALNAFAMSSGYGNNFESAMRQKEFVRLLNDIAQGKQELHLRGLTENEAKAYSDFYSSGFGKEIAPYLHSAGQAVNSLGGIQRMSRGIGLK